MQNIGLIFHLERCMSHVQGLLTLLLLLGGSVCGQGKFIAKSKRELCEKKYNPALVQALEKEKYDVALFFFMKGASPYWNTPTQKGALQRLASYHQEKVERELLMLFQAVGDSQRLNNSETTFAEWHSTIQWAVISHLQERASFDKNARKLLYRYKPYLSIGSDTRGKEE